MEYGYIRVSTREQNEDRQVIALREWGVDPKRIYLDKQSGKDFARPAYRRLVRRLKEGDVLVIKSIDRLGRNYEEILVQWRLITKEKRADVVVLDMPLLDTRPNRDAVMEQIDQIMIRRRKIERFIGSVKDLPELITEFDESLWAGLVESMTVYSKDRIVFHLACGMETEA